MSVNPRCWVHCLDCGEREMMRRSFVYRTSRQRCRACGGPLEISEAALADLARSEIRRSSVSIESTRAKHIGRRMHDG